MFLEVKFSIYLNMRVFLVQPECFHIFSHFCIKVYEPQHEKTYLRTCAPWEDSHQPAHPFSLIRVFFVCMKKLNIPWLSKTRPAPSDWRYVLDVAASSIHHENSLLKYIENFTSKNWKKNSDKKKNLFFFHISAQNIDCGYSLEPPRRGGSNEYLQSMFLSRNKKNNVYPCKP